MKIYNDLSIWMIAGSQHLYGDETIKQVYKHTSEIVSHFNNSNNISSCVEFKGVVTTPEEIDNICIKANADKKCAGIIVWMHTFSPSKMWINGLKILSKPILHLHTQYNRDIPWDKIDMDFMNLNQSAHGGREHGFINSKMKINRKIVVGYWKDAKVHNQIDSWIRAAAANKSMIGAKIARFGDNMRDVAVTEGNKVSAQVTFGYDVYGYGIGDLVEYINKITDKDVNNLFDEYKQRYQIDWNVIKKDALLDAAKLEIGIENFLRDKKCVAFTTTFEDLHGLCQLPGLACQRLMEKGFGFGAEGDWKTAALLYAMKVMSKGLKKGTSFMEDYTYHMDPKNQLVLGSHMLEVCPSIAEDSVVKLEVHPLGIGGKDDPARLVFDVPPGPSLNASLIDIGNRFRLILNEVDTVAVEQKLPNLPVARAVWKPLPNLEIAAAAWILCGGAHHTVYSKDVTTEMLEDYAEMCNIELVLINKSSTLKNIKNELKWNDLYYMVKSFSGNI